MKKKWLFLTAGTAALLGAGLPHKCDYTEYYIRSSKIQNPVKMILISDLHGASYGKNMCKLIEMINKEHEDAILIPGDLFDEFHGDENGFALLDQIRNYPVYYSTGNHEEHRRDVITLKEKIKEYGVNVLDYNTKVIQLNGNTLEIGGINCKSKENTYLAYEINKIYKTDAYRILLSHKPHWVSLYKDINCDLVVSGHAHGGQWCIPGTRIGAAAPQQGLLPKYIHGMHEIGNKKIIIGRGLTKEYHGIPRLYNNPEFVVIHLLPDVVA